MTSAKIFLLLGSINALLAVIFGAFGAHALKARLGADLLAVYQTGVQYHIYHALGLLAVGIIAHQFPPSVWIKTSGWLMFAGILLFSGSLYLLSLTSWRWLGAITPCGGMAFILAWLVLVIGIVRH
ncbi:MAG: DUF423 domain-containing protein [Gammaproteobacteria bacterium]